MDVMEAELLKAGRQLQISPQFYTQQLYKSLEKEITELFRDHFNLSVDFSVQYNDFAGIKKRTMSIAPSNDGGNVLLQKMVINAQLSLDVPNTKSLENELREFLCDGNDDLELRKQTVIKMVESITNEQQERNHDLSITQNGQSANEFNITELHANILNQADVSDSQCDTSQSRQDDNDDNKSEDECLLDGKQRSNNDIDDVGYLVEMEMAAILNNNSNEIATELNKGMSDLILSEIAPFQSTEI